MEQSLWWATDGVGDGSTEGYAQDQITEHWRMLFCQDPTTQGVALNYLGELLVTNPEWQTLRVPAGGGVVYGFPYRNTGNLDFVLSIPTLGTTGWRLVLRTDWVLHTVRAVLLQNDDGASGYPSLTQNAGYRWEISLTHGSITVGGAVTIVADDRVFLGSSAQLDHNDMANRTRRIFVTPTSGYNVTDGTNIIRHDFDGLSFPDNKLSVAIDSFAVPNDFVSTMIVTAMVVPWVNGNGELRSQARHSACAESITTHTADTGYGTIALGSGLRNCVVPLSLPNAALGDFVDLMFYRDGLAGADTVTVLYFMGWYIDYIADS